MSRPVRALARVFVRRYPTPPELARGLQRWVRDRVTYRRDRPTMAGAMGEEFASAAEVLQRRTDDCDGKSRVFVALARACGLEARIRPVFHGPDFVHVQAECRYPGSEREPKAEPGGWLLAELIVDGVGLGDDPMRAPRKIV